MKRSALLLAIALLALAPAIAHADSNTVLQGRVYDADGRPIANAEVTASAPEQTAKTRARADGRFIFFGLLPGRYTVSFVQDGYDPGSLSRVVVAPGETDYAVMHLPPSAIMDANGWGWSQRSGSSYVIY